jgi:type IV pilus assembly protein PilE
MNKSHELRGFTLIEIMIVVAVVAILAAIAYPSYQEQVRKSRRTEGQALLLDAASRQERFYTENNTYAANMKALGYKNDNQATENSWYQVRVKAASDTGYELEAAPLAAQLGDSRCGVLTIDAFGVKGEKGSAASWQDCW